MPIKIKATKRSLKGKKVKKLRRKKIIPGAITRYKKKTLLIQAPLSEVVKLKKASTTDLIEVEVEGDKTYKTLLTELTYDHITDEILSFNLTEITPESTIKVLVPVKIVGEPIAVKQGKGVLVVSKPAVKLVLNLNTLIQEIEVDVTSLAEVGDTIDVSQVLEGLPEGVKLASYNEINDAIATIVPPQKTIEEEQQEEQALEEQEVSEEPSAEEAQVEEAPKEEGAEKTQESE